MAKGKRLGEAEHFVLLALKRLGRRPSSGADIRDIVEERTGRVLSVSAVYVTLMRLEKKGFLTSCLGEPTPVRGGKARRQFLITEAGHEALDEVRRQWQRMWEGLPSATDGAAG